MKLSVLLSVWISVSFQLDGVEALVFDVLRNTSTLKSQEVCAVLRCEVNDDGQDGQDIQHIISIIISEKDAKEENLKPLASLSFLEPDVRILEDPPQLYASGKLSPKEGKLSVYLKNAVKSCLSGIFICELQYINSSNLGAVERAEKRLKPTTQHLEPNNQVSDAITSLRTVIADEVSKLGKQTQNVTGNFLSVVASVNQRLLRLEGLVEGDLQARLDNINIKLDKLEALLHDNVEGKLKSLTEAIGKSSDDIKSHATEEFLKTRIQMDIVEASIIDRISNTEISMNDSIRGYLTSSDDCRLLQVNVSSGFLQIQDNMSAFRAELVKLLSPTDDGAVSTNHLLPARMIMDTLLKIVHNISQFDIQLTQLRSDLDKQANEAHSNISNLNHSIGLMHDRFVRKVKEDVSAIESLVNEKMQQLDNQKLSIAALDREMKGALVNVEVSMKNVILFLKGIKVAFGI